MASFKNTETVRGLKEGRGQIRLLREKWPKAFPGDAQKVRPLASGIVRAIADTLGWSPYYARGVLSVWKSRTAYCTAVLRHANRYSLDGVLTTEEVNERARRAAKERLEAIAVRERRKAAEVAQGAGSVSD